MEERTGQTDRQMRGDIRSHWYMECVTDHGEMERESQRGGGGNNR